MQSSKRKSNFEWLYQNIFKRCVFILTQKKVYINYTDFSNWKNISDIHSLSIRKIANFHHPMLITFFFKFFLYSAF